MKEEILLTCDFQFNKVLQEQGIWMIYISFMVRVLVQIDVIQSYVIIIHLSSIAVNTNFPIRIISEWETVLLLQGTLTLYLYFYR